MYHKINFSPINVSEDQIYLSGGQLTNFYASVAIPNTSPKSEFILKSTPCQGATFITADKDIAACDYVVSPVVGKKMVIVTYSSDSADIEVITGANKVNYTLTNEPAEIFTANSDVISMVNDGRRVMVILDDRRRIRIFDLQTNEFTYALTPTPDNRNRLTDDNEWVDITWISGYFVLASKGGQVFHSVLNSDVFDQLDFAFAESMPDGLVALESLNNQLYLFGSNSIELWHNTGGVDFAFSRDNSYIFNFGCASRNTVVNLEIAILFLGSDGIVYQIGGGTRISRVSNDDIEQAIRAYYEQIGASLTSSDSDRNIRAFGYIEEGIRFYCLKVTYTDLIRVFVYDLKTGFWHERDCSSSTEMINLVEIDKSNFSVSSSSKRLIKAYHRQIAPDSLTRTATTSVITDQRKRVLCSAFDVEAFTDNLDDVDPDTIGLSFSDDYGQTNKGYTNSAMIPIKNSRNRWIQLGQFRNRNFKVSCVGKGVMSITTAFVDVEACND